MLDMLDMLVMLDMHTWGQRREASCQSTVCIEPHWDLQVPWGSARGATQHTQRRPTLFLSLPLSPAVINRRMRRQAGKLVGVRSGERGCDIHETCTSRPEAHATY